MSQKVTHVLLKGGVMLHVVGSRDEIVSAINLQTSTLLRLVADWNGKDIVVDINVDQVLMVENDHNRGEEPTRSQEGTTIPTPYIM